MYVNRADARKRRRNHACATRRSPDGRLGTPNVCHPLVPDHPQLRLTLREKCRRGHVLGSYLTVLPRGGLVLAVVGAPVANTPLCWPLWLALALSVPAVWHQRRLSNWGRLPSLIATVYRVSSSPRRSQLFAQIAIWRALLRVLRRRARVTLAPDEVGQGERFRVIGIGSQTGSMAVTMSQMRNNNGWAMARRPHTTMNELLFAVVSSEVRAGALCQL